jgi:hypothetical protein
VDYLLIYPIALIQRRKDANDIDPRRGRQSHFLDVLKSSPNLVSNSHASETLTYAYE